MPLGRRHRRFKHVVRAAMKDARAPSMPSAERSQQVSNRVDLWEEVHMVLARKHGQDVAHQSRHRSAIAEAVTDAHCQPEELALAALHEADLNISWASEGVAPQWRRSRLSTANRLLGPTGSSHFRGPLCVHRVYSREGSWSHAIWVGDYCLGVAEGARPERGMLPHSVARTKVRDPRGQVSAAALRNGYASWQRGLSLGDRRVALPGPGVRGASRGLWDVRDAETGRAATRCRR